MANGYPNQRTSTAVEQTRSQLDDIIRETEARKSNVISTAASVLMIDPKKLCDILRNVWKTSSGQAPLTNDEMFAGISMIARFELDPIAREVYVTRDNNGRLLTVIGVDGWIKILDRTEHYDGFEQEIHEEKGEVTWIETRIYSKNRRYPAVYRAFMSEYAKLGGYMAGKIPIHMLGIYSLRHAARRFTPLGAHVVTEEEAAIMGVGIPGAAESSPSNGTPSSGEPAKPKSRAEEIADSLASRVQNGAKSEPRREPGPTHLVGEIPRSVVLEQYLRDMKGLDKEAHCDQEYNALFGENSTIEWTPEEDQIAAKARDEQVQKIRASKSGRLFDKPSPVPS